MNVMAAQFLRMVLRLDALDIESTLLGWSVKRFNGRHAAARRGRFYIVLVFDDVDVGLGLGLVKHRNETASFIDEATFTMHTRLVVEHDHLTS